MNAPARKARPPMSDDVPYWTSVRQDLLVQVERLQPDDALRIVKALVVEE